ncbi:BQ5605_C011g06579 [Microbotryum silenes-dioicae]|uniref:BQ5605_C011g06579 protein n=1 Tax=Microbotryum silenes-dioicae TaxID=796604 RepID=A0A2X0NTD5_9BASI|nr:BQ5605_C011g06579 [Microbotryum silenes-dioicae]
MLARSMKLRVRPQAPMSTFHRIVQVIDPLYSPEQVQHRHHGQDVKIQFPPQRRLGLLVDSNQRMAMYVSGDMTFECNSLD